jgi:hypothetical protein
MLSPHISLFSAKNRAFRATRLEGALGLVSTLILTLGAIGCEAWAISGSGKLKSIEPDLQNATALRRLDVCCGFSVNVSQSETAHLKITTDDNLIPELIVEEHGDELRIGFPESLGGYQPSRPVEVNLALPNLDRVLASGGTHVELQEAFQVGRLQIEISGGGSLDAAALGGSSLELELSGGSGATLADLDLDTMFLDVSGGGSVSLDGKLGALEAGLSGGSELDAIECQTETTSLNVSGGGYASVHATEVLDVDASGGAEVIYRGEPDTIEKELSGGSTLRQE